MPHPRRLASLLVLALMTGLAVNPSPAQAAPTCFGKTATIVGTSGDDLLEGTARGDVIVGLGGRDIIRGFEGNDRLCGGARHDRLNGGAGSDRINGGRGADVAFGGPGDDLLLGGPGKDEIYEEAGNNIIQGGAGSDQLWGGGNDLIRGGPGSDELRGGGKAILQGGEGADSLTGSPFGDDTFSGGTGFDSAHFFTPRGVNANLETGVATGEGLDTIGGVEALFGTEGDDTLTGNGGDNLLVGFGGDDELVGGNGSDLLVGFGGDDELVGGNGSDTISFSFSGAVEADLVTGQATGEGTDTLSGIENLEGSPFDDTLNGDDNDNVLDGSDGTDTGDARGHVDGDTCISIENPANCETIQLTALMASAAVSAVSLVGRDEKAIRDKRAQSRPLGSS